MNLIDGWLVNVITQFVFLQTHIPIHNLNRMQTFRFVMLSQDHGFLQTKASMALVFTFCKIQLSSSYLYLLPLVVNVLKPAEQQATIEATTRTLFLFVLLRRNHIIDFIVF